MTGASASASAMLNPSDCVNNAVPKAHVNVNANIISAEILAIRLYTGFKTARPAKIIPTTATTVFATALHKAIAIAPMLLASGPANNGTSINTITTDKS